MYCNRQCMLLQQCAMVSKEKMASALDFDPGNSSYWSERHRDTVFGANYNAFATKFTGFSICHPVYDDTKCSSACNALYDLRCVASYQPPPSYFYPTGKTRLSMPTEHWCETTQRLQWLQWEVTFSQVVWLIGC